MRVKVTEADSAVKFKINPSSYKNQAHYFGCDALERMNRVLFRFLCSLGDRCSKIQDSSYDHQYDTHLPVGTSGSYYTVLLQHLDLVIDRLWVSKLKNTLFL